MNERGKSMKTAVIGYPRVGKDRELKFASEKYFKNEFLKDDATGKAYGLFIQNGVNHLGLYDATQGTVGMGQKASKVAYPKAFKVYGGYAYSAVYDSYRNQGVIDRVKIKE